MNKEVHNSDHNYKVYNTRKGPVVNCKTCGYTGPIKEDVETSKPEIKTRKFTEDEKKALDKPVEAPKKDEEADKEG